MNRAEKNERRQRRKRGDKKEGVKINLRGKR